MLYISYLFVKIFFKIFLAWQIFGQSRPTGLELRSTDFAWKIDFLPFLLPADPYGRPRYLSVLSGFLGRPTRSTALCYRALGFLGRPTRSTVRRFHALICLFITLFSLSPLIFSPATQLPLSLKNPFLSFPLKFLLNPSLIPSFCVRSSLSGPSLHQISRISRSRVWDSHFR